jgi:hypothetical protein
MAELSWNRRREGAVSKVLTGHVEVEPKYPGAVNG